MKEFLIVLSIVVIISIILFSIDYKEKTAKSEKNGGLKTKYKGFVDYVDEPLRVNKMELVTNTGNRLEYRFPIRKNNQLLGYIHLGIYDVYTSIIYCNAVSINGYKHKGFSKEIKNLNFLEPSDYDQLFHSFLVAITNSDDFYKLEFE